MGSECLEEFKIYPKTSFLSAQELISLRGYEGGSLKCGLKKTQLDGSAEEVAEIQRLNDELKKQLSCPRIERVSARSVAEWDPEKNAVKILKREGKFQSFGYTEDKVQYLHTYEALFLLELNRLELYYQSVLVSIEQAYVLLLGEEKSENYDNYLVYSTFSRAGYIVQKNNSFNICISEDECIWEILLSSLDETHHTPCYVRNSKQYKDTEASMKLSAERISKPNMYESQIDKKPFSLEDYIDFDRKFSAKRKVGDLFDNRNCKKQRFQPTGVSSNSSSSYLDILKCEPEYEEFRELFQKFEIVELRAIDDFERDCREVKIAFDLYLPTESFRKSEPKPPALRAIVLGSSENFPSRSQIAKAYHSQEYKVPLLVVSVSDSKHIQAFLYYFT